MTENAREAPDVGGAGEAAGSAPGTAAPVVGAAGPRRRRREVLKLFLVGGAAATGASVATALGFGLAGRRSSSGDAPADPDERMLTWAASAIDQNPIDTRQILIDEFERSYPTINVTLLPGPSNTDAKRRVLSAAIKKGGDAPDVYLGDVIWPAEFGFAKLAMPLDDLLPDDFWGRFEEPRLATASYGDRRYSVPFYANQGVLFYRKDLLRKYKKKIPKTWEELATTAEEVVAGEGAPLRGFIWQGGAYEGLTCVWTELIADAAGEPADARSLVSSGGAVRALAFLRDLIERKVTPKSVSNYQEPAATRLFNDDGVVFMRGWNTADTLIQAKPRKIGVTQLPTFVGRPPGGYSTIGGWNMFVNPHTSNRKLGAVRIFIEWMTGEQAQRILARHAQIPTHRNVRRNSEIAQGNEVLKVAQAALPVARPSNTPLYRDISRAVYTNINSVLKGEMKPESALAAARKEIELVLRD
jgi:multiple sugar transport system substrate-binding protein